MFTAPYARSFDLHGKVAIVTGGSLGIGAAITHRFVELGAKVAIFDIDKEHAAAMTAEIRTEGGIAELFPCNLGDIDDVDRAVNATVGTFGRIDVLVNNAGVFPMMPALEVTERLWDHVLDVNLKGAFFCAQHVARRMVAQDQGGAIVNIASIDALHPTGALVHYDASKGGLVMVTRALAKELAPHRIRVNAIAPGAIETPGAGAALQGAQGDKIRAGFVQRIPLRRMGTPDDIARAAVYLATDASDYVTGSTLVVDGGYLLT